MDAFVGPPLMKRVRPMREMIEDWAPELAARLGRSEQVVRERGLGAVDFSPRRSVEIRHGDFTVRVRFAFALIRPEQAVVAVFSEHWGYAEYGLLEETVVAQIDEDIYMHRRADDDVTPEG
jgi:hypothetical protein